jgi:F-box domain
MICQVSCAILRAACHSHMSPLPVAQYDMPRSEIPVDVLRDILEYVDKADLATMCRVSKICCSCSQDVLYRDIYVETRRVQETLAQSTHLARRVRSFDSDYDDPGLSTALRNMTSLRILKLSSEFRTDILDGCTFKLDSFECTCLDNNAKFIAKFLSSQTSLKYLTLPQYFRSTVSSLEATCLPNLTRINVTYPWLPHLIPGRPLNEVIATGITSYGDSINLSFFALSTTPIQKLTIDHSCLHPTPVHLLASLLPSLTHFTLSVWIHPVFLKNEEVCGLPLY